VVSVTPRPLLTPGKDPAPIVQNAEWAPGPVWTGAENFSPIGFRSPDRPVRTQSLYPYATRNMKQLRKKIKSVEEERIDNKLILEGYDFLKKDFPV
jgi:hypothetical protein